MSAGETPDRSLGANVLSGVSYLAGQQIAATLLGVLSMAVLVRHLGPSDYGLWAIATGVLGLSGAAAAPFDEAIRRFVPEAIARDDSRLAMRITVLAAGARIAFTVAAVFGVVLLAAELASVYPSPEVMAGLLTVGVLQVLATSLDNVTFGILLGLQRYGLGAAASVVTRLIFLGIVVTAVVAGWGLATLWLAASLGLLGISVAFLVLAVILLRQATAGDYAHEPAGWRDVWATIWSYTWPLWGNRANGLVYQHASRTLLGAFASPALVGLFSLARSASEHLSRLYQQLPQVLVPALAGHSESDRGPSLAPLRQVGRWAGPLGTWLSAAVLLLAPEIVRVFAGSDFSGAVPILMIFAVQPAFRLAVGVERRLQSPERHTDPVATHGSPGCPGDRGGRARGRGRERMGRGGHRGLGLLAYTRSPDLRPAATIRRSDETVDPPGCDLPARRSSSRYCRRVYRSPFGASGHPCPGAGGDVPVGSTRPRGCACIE